MSRFFHQTLILLTKAISCFQNLHSPLSLSPTSLLIHLGTAMDLHRNQDSALLYNIYAFTPCMDHFIMINLIIMHYSTVLLTFLGLIRLWHDTLLLIMIHIFCVYIVRSQAYSAVFAQSNISMDVSHSSLGKVQQSFKIDDIEGLQLSVPSPCNEEAPH